MAEEWAINGHRVVRRASLFGGKLVVLDASGALWLAAAKMLRP